MMHIDNYKKLEELAVKNGLSVVIPDGPERDGGSVTEYIMLCENDGPKATFVKCSYNTTRASDDFITFFPDEKYVTLVIEMAKMGIRTETLPRDALSQKGDSRQISFKGTMFGSGSSEKARDIRGSLPKGYGYAKRDTGKNVGH
ncbi:MAG: hypothetical protein HZB68_04070 [Candidatus Aenigmarchaeota archaeon]|nr:hypothetical protein [Candidatus Aenigmarchaeota archaeon]